VLRGSGEARDVPGICGWLGRFFRRVLVAVFGGSGCAGGSPNGSLQEKPVAVADALPSTGSDKELKRAGTYAGQWSQPVHGLSARLVVTLQQSPNSPRLGAAPLMLEVENTYSTPLAFINQPSFADKATWDAKGNALAESHVHAGNHLSGAPQWAVIPGDATLGLRVDTSIPVETGLCFGVLAPEAASISATLVARHREGPDNQWVGEIQLPPVQLTSEEHDP
jgi:hypothetical protein